MIFLNSKDILIYISFLCVDIFLSSSSARERAKERERERATTDGSRIRASLSLVVERGRFLERVDHHHSFIHHRPNFDYLVPPARTQQKTKYFSFFIFFSFAAFQSVDDGTRLKSYFHSNALQNYYNKIGRRATTPIRLRDRSRGKV